MIYALIEVLIGIAAGIILGFNIGRTEGFCKICGKCWTVDDA